MQYAREEDFPGASPAPTLDLNFMFIPDFCPLVSIFIDCVEEEVMEEPDMPWNVRVQPALCLKLIEKTLPLGSKVTGDLDPQAFDPRVVNTP